MLPLPSFPVQSPDTHSNRPSPPSHPLTSILTPTPINQSGQSRIALTESISRGVPHTFSGTPGGGGGGSPLNNTANSAIDRVGIPGQNLVDAMSSKFVPNIPAGAPLGGQLEMFQNGTVKRVSLLYVHKYPEPSCFMIWHYYKVLV